MEECPDNQTLQGVLDNTLSKDLENAVSVHLEQCARCQQRLDRAAVGDWTQNKIARNLQNVEHIPQAERDLIAKCTSDPLMQIVDEGVARDRLPPSEKTLGPNPTPTPTRTYLTGERIDAYEIVDELGRGGMGAVYRARDTRTQQTVALKVLHGHQDATGLERFQREINAADRVRHPNVVRILSSSMSPVPYLVLEYVNGPSLRDYLLKRGALDLKTILQFGLQIAEALQALHAAYVTHRDIKPANVVVDLATDQVKLTDFGLALIEGDPRLTLSGFVPGTPAYMSPEQVQGEDIDHRSDLFSLGTVLYAMCTGQSPFKDDLTALVMDRVRLTDPFSAEKLNPRIPPALAELIRWLHSKQAHLRPHSAAEVADILRQMLRRLDRPGGLSQVTLDDIRQRPPAELVRAVAPSGPASPRREIRDRRESPAPCAIPATNKPTPANTLPWALAAGISVFVLLAWGVWRIWS